MALYIHNNFKHKELGIFLNNINKTTLAKSLSTINDGATYIKL